MIPKILGFVKQDMWRYRVNKLRGPKGTAIRGLRVLVLSFREFASDQCNFRASALTFYSLLSIVPVFAMAFGIAKGFGVDKLLREKLMENMHGQQEVFTRIIEFSENMLQNTKGGIIAGIGLMLLFWTVIQVLSNIEMSFNHIWGIKKPRTLGQKFSDYLALMLIAPIIFIAASSASVFVISQAQMLTEKMTILGPLGGLILTAMQILPLTVFWGLLTYLYMFLPNGRIQFKSALLGGIVAGTVYQLVQWAYIHFQIGASNAGAVYGTFAALPLFLIWLHTSWRIVLYGAELAFAHQHEERFEFETDCMNASEEVRELLALRITQLCVTRFTQGEQPLSAEEISAELETPVRLTRELLDRLVRSNLLSIIHQEDERARHYQPARDVNEMTVQFVLAQMDKAGTSEVPVAESPELVKLREVLRNFEQVMKGSPQNVLLKDLAVPRSTLPAAKKV